MPSEKGRGRKAIDEDVVELGGSNRKLEFFDRILARWKKDANDALAQRLLERYLPDNKFNAADELEAWFKANRARLRFSDFGGYRWMLAPEAVKSGAKSEANQR